MSPLSLAADPYTPQLAPVGGSLVISALIALLPLLTVFVTLCLLYTSDAADERSSVDLGGRRIIKKQTKKNTHTSTTL